MEDKMEAEAKPAEPAQDPVKDPTQEPEPSEVLNC